MASPAGMAPEPAELAASADAESPCAESPCARQILPLIDHLARLGRRAADACEASGCLRPRHLIALKVLSDRGPMGQHALGEALSLDPSNVVGLLNELEDRGLITRRRDPADRRRHIVALSPSGDREAALSSEHARRIEDDLLRALSPAERATLYDLLSRAVGGVMSSQCADGSAPPCVEEPYG
jgi:MarR family transcriptional regulator, lower aerobic nicotinate degradation pathway regulator